MRRSCRPAARSHERPRCHAPPRSMMNSRRLIRRPQGSGQDIVAVRTCTGKAPTHVRFGSLIDMGDKSRAMSALPLKSGH